MLRKLTAIAALALVLTSGAQAQTFRAVGVQTPEVGAAVTVTNPDNTTTTALERAVIPTDANGNVLTGGGTVAQNSTTSGQSGALMQGAVTTAAPTYTTGKTDPISLGTDGGIRVEGPTGALALDATVGTTNTNLGAPGATACATDTSSCSLNALLQRIAQRLTSIIGGTAVTTADGGSVTLGSKADAKSTATDTTAVTAMQVLKEISAMEQAPASRPVTNAGTFAVQPTAASSGGASVASKQVANNTTSVAIDASPGTLYGVTVFNNSGTIAYLKIYNAAQGSTTCGSGTPAQRIMIPASTSGAGAIIPFPVGVAYSTAITSCVTTGFGDSDTTAPSASTYMLEFYYK